MSSEEEQHEAVSKATAVEALLGVSKKASNNPNSPHQSLDTRSLENAKSPSGTKSIEPQQQSVNSIKLEQSALVMNGSHDEPNGNHQSNPTVHVPIHSTTSVVTTTTTQTTAAVIPGKTHNSLPPAPASQSSEQTQPQQQSKNPPASSSGTATMAETQQPQQQTPHPSQQQQAHQHQHQHHHLINANAILEMTSIGFGIDSSPNAALGDATDAALKAVQDAMERSSLRLPISSPAHNLLQIKVKLGVPARQDGSGQAMIVNVARLSQFLPRVIPVLPIQVEVGGLFLPSECQGSPSICTAVASITLQSQAAALSVPVPSSPTMMPATQPGTQAASGPSTPAAVSGAPTPVASPPTSSPTHSSQALQHLNHLATAAASSPPASKPVNIAVANHASLPNLQTQQTPDRDVPRSNSMEMLAMISEQIRNKNASTTTQQNAATAVAASSIGAGLATAALQEAAMLNNNGRLIAVPKVEGARPMNIAAPSSSPTPNSSSSSGAADEYGDADARNANGGIGSYNYKKLPPGTTTKNNQRLFVKHRYTDYSGETPGRWENDHSLNPKGTIKLTAPPFPVKLHETLSQIEEDGYEDIVGWLPHGRSFRIHKQKEFAEIILPRYFVMTKKSSFLRQLNLYSFNRFSAGPDQGSYYHELFLKGIKFLCRRMVRQKVNGNRIRSAGNPDEEPNLHLYPVCPPTTEAVAAAVETSTNEHATQLPLKKRARDDEQDNDGGSGSSEENYEPSNAVSRTWAVS